MYWSHRKDDTKTYLIEISMLDGSNRSILENCTHSAESLVMDFDKQRLYYVFTQSGSIWYIDLIKKTVRFVDF